MNVGIAGVISLWMTGCTYEAKLERRAKLEHQHKARVVSILETTNIPSSQINPLTSLECERIGNFKIMKALTDKWAEEIFVKTNIEGLEWDQENGLVRSRERSSVISYDDLAKATFERRHLAVAFRMKDSTEWQAFTQEQINILFLESIYAGFSRPKDWACNYTSQKNEWKVANILSGSPSLELAKALNSSQIDWVPGTTISR